MTDYPFAPFTKAAHSLRQFHETIEPGMRIGRLTVLHPGARSAHGSARWVCQCDCGNKPLVFVNNLKNEYTRSCGCYWRDLRTQDVVSMLGGEARFGRLTFVEEVDPLIGRSGRRLRRARFTCDCGRETVADIRNVRRGLTKSCGCTLSASLKAAFKGRGTNLPGL